LENEQNPNLEGYVSESYTIIRAVQISFKCLLLQR